MSSVENAAILRTLRDEQIRREREHSRMMADIDTKRALLEKALHALKELGCNTLAEAEALKTDLQGQIDALADEIKRMLI